MGLITRRSVLAGAGSIALGATFAVPASAQSAGSGLLAKLQAEKKVRVGTANQAPFSVLNPDGTMSGLAPEITKKILDRLGITQIEGFVGTYGELIPGLMAGRWDFISASLTTTSARCKQVLFADPLTYDGPGLLYMKKPDTFVPTQVADLVSRSESIGIKAGGNVLRSVVTIGVPQDRVSQYTSDMGSLDGLLAGRNAYTIMSIVPLRALVKQRKLEPTVGLLFPIPDLAAHASSCAFRLGDTDLHAAYQKEFRAMKKSGEFAEIATRNGFETPEEVFTMSNEEACKIE